MERYDGKTRKDDIKKWSLIISGALILFIGLQVGLHFLKKANAPDYTIATLCTATLTEEAIQDLKDAAAPIIVEKLGKDTAKISVREYRPGLLGEFDESVSAAFAGDYTLFIISNPDKWSEDLLAERVSLSGTKLYGDLLRSGSLYGCILNTNEEDMETARQIIAALQAQ